MTEKHDPKTEGAARTVSEEELLAVGSSLGLDDAASRALAAWLGVPRYVSERRVLEALVERARGGDAAAREDVQDAFGRVLPIGTGGRRGPVGPGINRINDVTLRETVAGLVAAMKSESLPTKVAVVYDTRRDSRRFAYVVAAQLRALGVDVTLVDAPRPTPLLSFSVRRWGCGAGVVISASHNPPGDNGIKIYGPDGAQVIGARDRALMTAIGRAGEDELPEIAADAGEVLARGVERIDPDAEPERADGPYLAWVEAQGVWTPPPGAPPLHVVFTPLHGVGHRSVVPVLRAKGLRVDTVEAQCDADGGNFSTVKSANPEAPESMEMAVAQAVDAGAALVLATDPDADRVGACARDGAGRFVFIDGNRLGALMLDHVLRNAGEQERAEGWVLTTAVTTPLVRALADEAGVRCVDDLLVGFKHHAAMVAEAPTRPVVFACEESHGYVRGTAVRDKDGAVGALLIAECAAACAAAGETLFDRLDRIWRRLGYHRERTISIYARGAAGRAAISRLMDGWRARPPTRVGGLEVVEVEDRLAPRDTGSTTRDLPGNVLRFELASENFACRVVVRPSGTEPKAKVYVLARGRGGLADLASLTAQREAVDALVERVGLDARAQAEAIMTAGEAFSE